MQQQVTRQSSIEDDDAHFQAARNTEALCLEAALSDQAEPSKDGEDDFVAI